MKAAKKKASLIPEKILDAKEKVDEPIVSVNYNNDQAIIAWRYSDPITNCIGFAIYKRSAETDKKGEPIVNRVGFADEENTITDTLRPSTEWPIQRFIWTDYDLSEGDKASYKIVPILVNGNELQEDGKNSSDWSPLIFIRTGFYEDGTVSPYHAYFNRGIIASQFVSRMMKDMAGNLPGKSVKAAYEGEQNPLRDFLGGFLDNKLFEILDEIISDETLCIYGALYELHQTDLIDKLCSISDRAHIILANGAAKKKNEDKNKDSRKTIKDSKVNVYDRIVDVTKKHFAHNKFLVICKDNKPLRVWSGSTNWTPGGVFAQVNNGILIEDTDLAKLYLEEWEALKSDCENNNSEYGPDLYKANKNAKKFSKTDSRVWFTPTQNYSDLKDVEDLIENAQESVLFLMFNPGSVDTFFNYILDFQERKENVFVHGVINSDPGKTNPLIFFHKGKTIQTDWNAIVPANIKEEFAYWYKETSAGLVTIHSKILVIDPFGKNPYLITGSHNFGPKASLTNDENLLIINDARLAQEYAVNIMAVYDHYRWRYSLSQEHSKFAGLSRDIDWMAQYMANEIRMHELDIWIR